MAQAQSLRHQIARMGEEAGHFARMLAAPEAREAFQAFFEKRKPNFSAFE
jgi:enoyl-CoA hydratase/carnithine racemase